MSGNTTLVLCPESDLDLGLFSELDGRKDVLLKYVRVRSGLFVLARKTIYTLNYIFGRKIPLPKWLFRCNLEKWSRGADRVIVRSNVLEFVDPGRFEKLRRRGVRCDLLLLDSMDADSATIRATRHLLRPELWDEIITFDRQDAEKYGFSFKGFHYYSRPLIPVGTPLPSSAYFVGSFKGNRTAQINGVYSFLSSNGVRCHFDVLVGKKAGKGDAAEGVCTLRKSIPYSAVLKGTVRCGCVVEIVQENQHGPSLRYFEAVVFNRKLLTNNPRVVDFPYYNPDYMKVFKDAGDIDIDWIKSDIKVDYNYKGDFSPLFLI